MKKAIILARVSTPQQAKQGLSLDEIQLPRLREYADTLGLEIEQEFVFQETADEKIRRKFDEMISLLKERKDIKAIISFRVDRLTRNYRDAVAMDDLRVNYDKELHFVEDRLVLDANSYGRDIQDWDLKVFLAKQHINRLKEDSNNTLMAKLKSGEQYGKAPYGYKNITLTNNKKGVEVLPFESGIVQKIYEWYATGTYSMEQVRDRIQHDYGVKMHKSKMDKILGNPYYYGMRRYKGQLHPHIYPPLISKDIFNHVQDIKAGRVKRNAKFAGKPYVYRGMLYCAECGCTITPEYHQKKQKNGNVHDYVYYHCTGSKGKHDADWVSEKELDKQFASIYKQMNFSQEDLDWMTSSLMEAHQGKKEFNETLFDEYNAQIKRLQTMIENAYEDKLQGRITQEEYDKYHQKFRSEQDDSRKKLAQLQQADEDYYITASYLLELASRSYELFMGSEMEQKRELISLTVQNLSLKDGNIEYVMQKPFDSILAAKDRPLMGDWRGSNPRPSVPQTDALPTELQPPCFFVSTSPVSEVGPTAQ